jgi:hypothetical protein
MEPLGHRTTLIIALALVLVILSVGFVLTKIADESRHVPCSVQFSNVTCPTEK